MKNIVKKICAGLMVLAFVMALGATKVGSTKICKGGKITPYIDPPGSITMLK